MRCERARGTLSISRPTHPACLCRVEGALGPHSPAITPRIAGNGQNAYGKVRQSMLASSRGVGRSRYQEKVERRACQVRVQDGGLMLRCASKEAFDLRSAAAVLADEQVTLALSNEKTVHSAQVSRFVLSVRAAS